ncbi:MAG: hypothetical protein E4G99_01990 [Anaerolineales bacterium]|nr:MAG: hypothetical protein E4G99_01990 [Anaerolineales bacterium]
MRLIMPKVEAKRLSFIILLLGPLLLFGPMLVRGEVLFWGTPMLQFVPWQRLALETLRQGEIPLWNSMLGMGAPLLANLQSALLYPPNLLLWLFGPENGNGYLVTLHVLFAGVGMLLLGRKLGLGAFGQMVAGITFSLSGYMVARAWFISINHTAAWLPWILLCAEQVFDRMEQRPAFKQTLPASIGLGLTLAMQWLAGHAQTSWYSLLMLGGWTLWRLSKDFRRDSIRWVLARLLFAGVLALILSAAQLLPTLEYLSLSQRASSLDREFALTYSFWPWRILGFLFPNLFGNPANGDYWGYGNFWEDAIYIGILPILFGLASLWRGLRKSDNGVSLERFLLLTSGVTILLALGKNTPVFPFLFDHIPTFNLFQAPARWNLLLIFCLALLAGSGAERWLTPSGRGLYWTRLFTAGSGVIAIATYLGLRLMPQVETTFVRSMAVGGILLTISGLLTLFLPKDRISLKVGIVGTFLLVDLILAGQGLNPATDPSVYEGNILAERGIVTDQRLYMPSALEQRLKFEETHRFDVFDPGIEWETVRRIALPNASLLDGIASVNNFDPMVPERYAAFLEAFETLGASQQEAWLSWMGVAYRISPDPENQLDVIFEPVVTQGRVHLPAQAVFVESPDQALDQVISGKVDLETRVILEGEMPNSAWAGGGAKILAVNEPGPQELEISVDAPNGSWLVLADTWYPGWKASVDGMQTRIFRANYLFRAVAVPPGTHHVAFQYRPMSFLLGSVLSLIGLVGVTTTGLLCYRKN